MATKKVTAPKGEKAKTLGKEHARHIKTPRLTEKATKVAEGNVYTFNIDVSANKKQVTDAIIALYGVTPQKVNIVMMRKQYKFARGKLGMTKAHKKAYVTLKKGDKITLM